MKTSPLFCKECGDEFTLRYVERNDALLVFAECNGCDHCVPVFVN